MRIFKDASYDWMGMRRKAYVVSGTALALSLALAIFWQVREGSWLNYGVDFTGGTLVQVRFQEPVEIAELRGVVDPVVQGVEITAFGGENEFLIRAPLFEEGAESVSDEIGQALAGAYDAAAFEVVRTEAVGPIIGEELREKAVLAVLLSFGLTLIYLAFRFEWRFGAAAVLATAHDTLLTLGFISAFQFEFSLTIVAAVLTNIGYSLNDTIVIFDRVRENLHKGGRRQELGEVINRGINETLPRTTLTSGTTLAALLALWILGTEVIQDFALILIFGIVIGTFSSMLGGPPLLLEIRKRWGLEQRERRAPAARAGAGI